MSGFSETDFIKHIASRFSCIDKGECEGIGDDCAVIPITKEKSLVVTTDMLLEGSHFTLETTSALSLGHKALAVNVSDIVSMGAKPLYSFLSIALNKDISDDWKMEFMEGYASLSQKYGIALLGGDTTSSVGGVVINVTAIGIADNKNIKRRSAAVEGDIILCSSTLGDSATGLKLLSANLSKKSDAKNKLISAHIQPKMYVEQGQWLASMPGVHAMMDISDGIAKDLLHILQMSGKGAEIELKKIPLSEQMIEVCDRYDWDKYSLAVEGGEDFSLLMTVDSKMVFEIKDLYIEKFGEPLYEIGSIVDGDNSIKWLVDGKQNDKKYKGFLHF